MTIDYRIRNIVIAAVLAAGAIMLTVVYVNSARHDEANKNENVTVYVANQDFAVGTPGSKVAGGLEARSVSSVDAAPEAVTSPQQLEALYTTETVYAGEQVTMHRFAPPSEQGIRSQLKGTQRAIQVPGDANQVLAGTLQAGDRVDVITSLKNPNNTNQITSLTALRNLRVLVTDDKKSDSTITKSDDGDHAVILAVTGKQAQQLFYVMKNGDWSLQLRAVKKPKEGAASITTYRTVLASGTSR